MRSSKFFLLEFKSLNHTMLGLRRGPWFVDNRLILMVLLKKVDRVLSIVSRILHSGFMKGFN